MSELYQLRVPALICQETLTLPHVCAHSLGAG